MTYSVRLYLDSYRRDERNPDVGHYLDTYSALLSVRAVSARHAREKALAKAPEKFRTVYYREAVPEMWRMILTAEIVGGGN